MHDTARDLIALAAAPDAREGVLAGVDADLAARIARALRAARSAEVHSATRGLIR